MVEKLKGKAAQKAYRIWKLCIHSGINVKIEVVEDRPVAMGFCRKKDRDVDFEYECVPCKKFSANRKAPKHERTALRKARIGTARRRSIANRNDLFDTDKWRSPGNKKR